MSVISTMYSLTLPDLPQWSLNKRGHWSERAETVKAWRAVAGWTAAGAGIPRLDKASITLVMTPADRRRRDPDGIVGALKPCIDGLVDAGVLADDSWRHVSSVSCRIDTPDRTLSEHHWVLEIVPDPSLVPF